MAMISVTRSDVGISIIPLTLPIPGDDNPLILKSYILWQIRYVVCYV